MRKITLLVFILAAALGCSTTQQGAGVGAVVGGVGGAIIGHQSGHTGTGAVIGAAAGGLTGALVGEQLDTMFCPSCGRRYTGSKSVCAYDGAALQPIRR
jgi:uncharacterized protein YcfJ